MSSIITNNYILHRNFTGSSFQVLIQGSPNRYDVGLQTRPVTMFDLTASHPLMPLLLDACAVCRPLSCVSCDVVLITFTLFPLLGQLIWEGFAGVYEGAIPMLGAAYNRIFLATFFLLLFSFERKSEPTRRIHAFTLHLRSTKRHVFWPDFSSHPSFRKHQADSKVH